MKKHKPLTKLSENIVQNIKNIENEVKGRSHRGRSKDKDKSKVDIKDYLQNEDKKKLLEKTKELYMRLPKGKDDIFAFNLNWNSLFKFDVPEKVARPWIGKKIKEYMGSEEPTVVSLIVKILGSKPTP